MKEDMKSSIGGQLDTVEEKFEADHVSRVDV